MAEPAFQQHVLCYQQLMGCAVLVNAYAVFAAFLRAHQPPHAASSTQHFLHPGQAYGRRDQIQGNCTNSLSSLQGSGLGHDDTASELAAASGIVYNLVNML